MRLLDDQICAHCPALAASRSRIVHGYGDPYARIVLVGEAPGWRGADRTGVPFWGDKSGRVLQRILHDLGLAEAQPAGEPPRLRCFITNVVRCCPPANRAPTLREQANCAPWLARELDAIDPWLVVPIGLLALRAVCTRYLGELPRAIRPLHATPLRANRCIVVPLVHPSRISHAQIAQFIQTMRQVLSAPP